MTYTEQARSQAFAWKQHTSTLPPTRDLAGAVLDRGRVSAGPAPRPLLTRRLLVGWVGTALPYPFRLQELHDLGREMEAESEGPDGVMYPYD